VPKTGDRGLAWYDTSLGG